MPPCSPHWAFFLDVDGTLLEIAATPDAAQASRREVRLVEGLQRAAGGALALVSGRSLEAIDELFAPLKVPAAGQHGFERRDARGRRHRHRFPVDRLRPLAAELRAFAGRHGGLVLEDKGASLALHYRLASHLAEAAHEEVARAAATLGDLVEVQAGKMVWELKPAGRDKGTAIAEFLHEPPFAGRTPVFIGDDATDEPGFRAVNALGGHSIKVGSGGTAASWQLDDPAAARAWLEGCAARR